MKRGLLILAILIISLTGCGSSGGDKATSESGSGRVDGDTIFAESRASREQLRQSIENAKAVLPEESRARLEELEAEHQAQNAVTEANTSYEDPVANKNAGESSYGNSDVIDTDEYISQLKSRLYAIWDGEEYYKDIYFDGETVMITPDISAINSRSSTPLPEDSLGLTIASAITDEILEIEPYPWTKIVIDCSPYGTVTRTQNDIEDNGYGINCFYIPDYD